MFPATANNLRIQSPCQMMIGVCIITSSAMYLGSIPIGSLGYTKFLEIAPEKTWCQRETIRLPFGLGDTFQGRYNSQNFKPVGLLGCVSFFWFGAGFWRCFLSSHPAKLQAPGTLRRLALRIKKCRYCRCFVATKIYTSKNKTQDEWMLKN